MTWTAPMTYTATSTLTDVHLNTYLRDNLRETMPYIAATAGEYFVSEGANSIASRSFNSHFVDTTYNVSTAGGYTSSGSAGPIVTTVTGTKAIVFLTANMRITSLVAPSTSALSYMGLEITGATPTVAAVDADAMIYGNTVINKEKQLMYVNVYNDLTPGTNTFTAKYQNTSSGGGSSTSSFSRRRLVVLPY